MSSKNLLFRRFPPILRCFQDLSSSAPECASLRAGGEVFRCGGNADGVDQRSRKHWPDLEMYNEDGAHASETGSEFAAKHIWSVIHMDLFRKRGKI